MYKSGKAYNSFAETINAVAGARPQIKKQLTQAWDYAFSWVADEPFGHHPAMPAGILIALMSLSLLWGWPQVAAAFGLAWAGVLRIGEVLQATRSDLVLPGDAVAGTDFAMLKIREPKTRGRHAKASSSKNRSSGCNPGSGACLQKPSWQRSVVAAITSHFAETVE